MIKKHSVTINGHRSSISLEDPFWHGFRAIAAARGMAINALITQIDAARDPNYGLASAVRVFVLDYYRDQARIGATARMIIEIRDELADEASAIYQLTQKAFAAIPHTDGREGAIIDALRCDGDLTLSLVAVHQGDIIGHIAFSPATISRATEAWFGLGPISVAPEFQRQGIGGALIEAGLARLRPKATGVVLIGEPDFYTRFGFKNFPELGYHDIPIEYVMALRFHPGAAPAGDIKFAPGFDVATNPDRC